MDASARGAGRPAPFDAEPPVNADDAGRDYLGLLGISAGLYALFHHIGSLPSGTGSTY